LLCVKQTRNEANHSKWGVLVIKKGDEA
jgi:hypothetical protein